MRYLLTFFLMTSLCPTHFGWATPLNHLTQCLGQEELLIHQKKDTGPIYHLNQKILSLLLQLPDSIEIHDNKLTKICKDQGKSASLLFLKEIVTSDIFPLFTRVKSEDIQYGTDATFLTELKKNGLEAFIDFLNAIQAQSPSPDCLTKFFPELKHLLDLIRYWEADKGLAYFLENEENIASAFKKLEQDGFGIKDCKKIIKPKKS